MTCRIKRIGRCWCFRPTIWRATLVATLSLQNPEAFQSLAALVNQLVAAIGKSAGGPLPPDSPDNLADLFGWLSRLDERLEARGGRLLLALDEYEQLDQKIGAGVFPEDLLATIRESVQSHRRITWVLAGSHAITELTHAPWPSYLVSLRLIEVPPFTLPETRLLLTEPLRHSNWWASGVLLAGELDITPIYANGFKIESRKLLIGVSKW